MKDKIWVVWPFPEKWLAVIIDRMKNVSILLSIMICSLQISCASAEKGSNDFQAWKKKFINYAEKKGIPKEFVEKEL